MAAALGNPLLLLFLAVAPTGFLIKYILVRDKYKHEPMRLILVTFALGAVLVSVALALELALSSGIDVLDAFFPVAVSEEFVKFAAVRLKAYRSSHFYEVMDGIVFGVAAALGFATVENIMFVIRGGVAVALIRAFLSVPGHAAYGGIMGFYLGMAKSNRTQSKSQEWRLISTGLAIAIALHGLYDSFPNALWFIALTVISWAIFLRLIKKALAMSPVRWGTAVERGLAAASIKPTVRPPARYCNQCGASLRPSAQFCESCGHPIHV